MPDPPLACTLNGREASERQAVIAELWADALINTQPTHAGLRARLRDAPDIELRVRDVIEAESACCPFLTFELVRVDDHLSLEIAGPADARTVIEAFFAPAPA